MITSDHGNAEAMVDPDTGTARTYHTTNPVPLILLDGSNRPLRARGSLRDVTPTLLAVLGVPPPAEMTGSDLRLEFQHRDFSEEPGRG
jgi:2,3-bisphosphoglycerate-independent phosphoglycerate mutase